MKRRDFILGAAAVCATGAPRQRLVRVQPELFAAPGAQPNCWGDFDNDGDLDLFVGFKAGAPNRLYRNDAGTFVEVGQQMGVADLTDTRAAAWSDYDADGNLELYIGFTRRSGERNKLYRKMGGKFVDVAHELGVDAMGETRQVSWIDFDNDGRVDLFVAFRDAPNRLFHNEGNRFVNVAPDLGVDDPRKTVGAVWFDFNQDGRLDVFCANQDGTLNGLFENRGGKFVDVAHELGMDAFGRAATSEATGQASPITTTTAGWICLSRVTGRIFCSAMMAEANSRTSRKKWVWKAESAPRRRIGAITITTGAWICTCLHISTSH